jgi:hypothetical protein
MSDATRRSFSRFTVAAGHRLPFSCPFMRRSSGVPRVSVYLGRFEAAFNPVNKYGDVWIFVVFPPGNRLDLIADFRHMDEL